MIMTYVSTILFLMCHVFECIDDILLLLLLIILPITLL